MSKYTATYEFEIESGEVPAEAIAEYLMAAEKSGSMFNCWELAGQTIQLISVQVKET